MISGLDATNNNGIPAGGSDGSSETGNTLDEEVSLTRDYIDSLDERATGGTFSQNTQYLSGDATPQEMADFLLLFTGTGDVPAVQQAYDTFIADPSAENLATLRTEVETHVTHYGVSGVPELSEKDQAYENFIDDPTGENLSDLQEATDMEEQVDSMSDYMDNIPSYPFHRERDTFTKIMAFKSPEPMDVVEQAELMVKFAYCENNPEVQQALADFKADPSSENLENLITVTKANEGFDALPPVDTTEVSEEDSSSDIDGDAGGDNEQTDVNYNNATLPPIGFTVDLDPPDESDLPPSVEVVTHLPGKGFIGDDGKVYSFEHDDDEWEVNSNIAFDATTNVYNDNGDEFILFNGDVLPIDSQVDGEPKVNVGSDVYIHSSIDGWELDDSATTHIHQNTVSGTGEYIEVDGQNLDIDARIPGSGDQPRVLIDDQMYTYDDTDGWQPSSKLTFDSTNNIYFDNNTSDAFIKIGESWAQIGGQHPGADEQPKVTAGDVVYTFDEQEGWIEDPNLSFDSTNNTFQNTSSDEVSIVVDTAYLTTDAIIPGSTGEQPKALVGDTVYTFDETNGWIEDTGYTFDTESNLFMDTQTNEPLILAGQTLISIDDIMSGEDEDSPSLAIAGTAVYAFDETTGWVDQDLTFDPTSNIFKNDNDEQFILIDGEFREIAEVIDVEGSTQPTVKIEIDDDTSFIYQYNESDGWQLSLDDFEP